MRSNMNSGYSQILYSACVILILLWQLQNDCSTIQACGTLSLDKPVLKSGVLTLEEHSILNMTFSFRNETCNTSSEIKFKVEARPDREGRIWAPLCEIMMKSNSCRGSFHQNMTCMCLTNFTYIFVKKVDTSEPKYWKLSTHMTPSAVNFTLNVTATTVQTVLTSNETENQLIGKVIYVLGAVIFIIICMAIVICVIVRKLHRKARYPQLETPELRSCKYPQERNEMTLSSDSQERQTGNLTDETCGVNYQCSDSEVTLEMKIKVPISNRHHTTRRESENQFEYLTPTSDPPKLQLYDQDYQEICEESISFANSKVKAIMFR